ncbi:MAG: lamin tail domain-containing protein, partial [Verrucomicrobiota bacterium]
MALLLFLTGIARGEVVISELMAAGQSVIADEDAEYPDWIELHNSGGAPVDLTGWHLSDNHDKPLKWTFPAVSLPPDGYLVIFASGKNRVPTTGNLHASFSLNAGGEELSLAQPGGLIVSAIDYPQQLPEVSYDGSSFLAQPTPGGANAQAIVIAMAPTFSQPHGFQQKPFALTLTTTTPAAGIRYTLDGSEPLSTSPLYTTPLLIKATTVVRAATFAPQINPSPSVTRTYLFTGDIVQQSRNGAAPRGWPATWGEAKVDYGMDPRIAAKGPNARTIQNDLRTLPSLSIAMALDDLFDPADGIYSHSNEKGREWERPMSLELIDPAGTPGFQINGGIRIRGGASRDINNPKHSFRFLFRKEYGASALKYPLFGGEGASKTSYFDIRWDHLDSWNYIDDSKALFLRDIFGRHSQLATGQPAKRGQFFHLYINGQYWGAYNSDERVTSSYCAEYFGGSENDYDIVKFDAESIGGDGFTDGTLGSWRRLYDAGIKGFRTNDPYFKVQGLNPDGSRNKDFERLLDVDNLIDYMLVGIYCAATDNPPSGGAQNNWYSIRSRKDDFGFRFFVHDFELSMLTKDDNIVESEPVENPFEFVSSDSVNPWHYWQAMRQNAEFRLRVADRIQKHFFHGGALSTEACTARWQALMDQLDRAIVAESARWGDAAQRIGRPGHGPGPHPVFASQSLKARQALFEKRDGVRPLIGPGIPPPGPQPQGKTRPHTREQWLAACNAMLADYFPNRSGIVLDQLSQAHLYPSLNPPVFPQALQAASGRPVTALVESGLSMTNPNTEGQIYYTTDGSDPRRIGGAVSPSATLYTQPVNLARTSLVRARVFDGTTWSAIVESSRIPGPPYDGLKVTEIHYNPPALAGATGDDGEFIELKNTGLIPLPLGGASFTAGIEFTFPENTTLLPGAFFILARNPAVFTAQHPGINANGTFTGKLSDDGETLTLVTANHATIFSMNYGDHAPWPVAADALGFSLVHPNDNKGYDPSNWRASAVPGGSPGADDPAPAAFASVVINEVLAHPGAGAGAAIELFNPALSPADISGWWLSNEQQVPKKFRIPQGTVIAPGGYLVFTAAQFGADFTLAATGDAAWIFSADSNGALTGYVHGFDFGATLKGVSIGRHINSDEEEQFPSLVAPSLGNANTAPRNSMLRITEIHYAPAGGQDEFIEIENLGDNSLPLEGAKLDGFVFPAGSAIPAYGRLLLTAMEPAAFREKYAIAQEVAIFGPTSGTLPDNEGRVTLQWPVTVEETPGFITLESVRYSNRKPWPTGAAGFGGALQRIRSATYADDPASWMAATPTPGVTNTVNAPPVVALTSPADGMTVLPPATVLFTATAHDPDGTVAKVEFLVDNRVVGTVEAEPYTFVWKPAPGLHDLTARAIDNEGAVTETDFVTVDVDANENGVGRGLRGEYFPNTDLSGNPIVRNDAEIDFDWAETSPMEGIPREGFSVRWTGKLLPRTSGDHTLILGVAGGVRLYVNGRILIDQWDEVKSGGTANFDAPIALTAYEPAEIVIEYAERDGFGQCALSWYEPGTYIETPVIETQLYLPDQDPNALGISLASELPARRVGRIFQTRLDAANGVPPYLWSISQGTLPPGITLGSSGVLGGAAQTAGIFRFTVRLADQTGATVEKPVTLRITDASHPELRPVVRITTPANGTAFGEGNVMVAGTAGSSVGLARVRYSLNDGPWHLLAGTAQWNVSLDSLRGLVAGGNTLKVVAVDVDGRESLPATVRFNRVLVRPLKVSITGAGTVSPGFLGTTQRTVNRSYSMVAKPAPGWIFREWLGASGFDERLHFQMSEGLEITALFIPNPYIEATGTYTGLVGGDLLKHENRGAFSMQLTRTGG